MRIVLSILSACLLLGGCLSLSGCGLAQLPIGHSADGDDYLVTAIFPRADRIRLGTEVRAGQQLVGRVHHLSTDGRRALVDLSLSQSVPLPADITASLELPSALGEPFVQLTLPQEPSTESLSDGDTLENTELGPELESSLATMGLVLNGSGLDQLETIMTEMNAAFGGRGPQVRELVHSADRIMANAAQHQADFDRVLAAAGTVSATLAENKASLDAGLTVASPTMELLVRQRDHVASLVESTSSLASSAQELFGGNQSQIATGVDELAHIVDSIQSFNDSVTPALANMNEFIAGFDGAVHGDYLVFDGALDLPETVGELMTGGRLAHVPATLEQLLVPGRPR
ncbi:MCE family protein [Rhodococcus sp. G-MC3]|uniref:MCE family protein n=1 Tax=Rhodococcus sp. G-MC3 TaxID=3046209 RepID=UPI0024BA5132|nr:MCE family protein [Rhodococcus sp. G-MC3]MDJ0395374.1 MCE family protein [Rhodococcus sp. G-MC3]